MASLRCTHRTNMSYAKNPYSQVNAAGYAIVGLSFFLLNTVVEGGNWLERHAPFCSALGIGILLSLLYVRVWVRRDQRTLRVAWGLWPLRFSRGIDVREFKDVYIDAVYFRSALYMAYVRWRSSSGKERRMLLTATGPEAVRSGVEIAVALDVPVITSKAFGDLSGEESRKIVSEDVLSRGGGWPKL